VTEQPASAVVTGDTGAHGLDARTGQPHVHEAHHGRPVSWAVAAIIIVGFTIGGIALPAGPVWWLFWAGAAIVVIGGIIGAAARIMDDWY
jgi:hypothetical protein